MSAWWQQGVRYHTRASGRPGQGRQDKSHMIPVCTLDTVAVRLATLDTCSPFRFVSFSSILSFTFPPFLSLNHFNLSFILLSQTSFSSVVLPVFDSFFFSFYNSLFQLKNKHLCILLLFCMPPFSIFPVLSFFTFLVIFILPPSPSL